MFDHFSWRDLCLILTVFCFSRFVYLLAGLEFDTSMLETGLQFIDVELLKHRLVESLTFYHATPPLLNLLAGAGLKLFGEQAPWFFSIIFHLLGLLTAIAIFDLTRLLTGHRPVAWCLTVVLLFNPAFVLYENWFMYTMPTLALLSLSAWFLLKYLKTDAALWCACFFGTAGLLVLTRAIFHFYWLLLLIAILLSVASVNRRQLIVFAALPVLVCGLWYGKNLYLFGSFSAGSLLGLSLSNVTSLAVPKAALQPHVDAGRLSRFAVTSRYRELPRLLNEETLAPKTGIPVLDENKKSNGRRNFNSLEMKAVSEYYRSDSLTVLKLFPDRYLSTISISHQVFFSPGSMFVYFSEQNRASVKAFTRIYNPLLYGAKITASGIEQPHFGFSGKWFIPTNMGFTLTLLWLMVVLWASTRSLKTIFTANWSPSNIIVGYVFGNLLLIYLAGTYLELSENNRYRYIGEPLFWVLVAMMFLDGLNLLKRTRQNAGS